MLTLKTYDKKFDIFIEDFFKILETEKANILISTTNYVCDESTIEGTKANGWISQDDSGQMEFAIAVGKDYKIWGPTMVHESCHVDQYIDIRNGADIPDNSVAESAAMWRWMDGNNVKYSDDKVKQFIKNARDMELDNEIRTIEKIKKYNLDIDIEDYARRANAYILFYTYIAQNRCWYVPGKEPYVNDKILKKMSSNMGEGVEWDMNIPKRLNNLFKGCCEE